MKVAKCIATACRVYYYAFLDEKLSIPSEHFEDWWVIEHAKQVSWQHHSFSLLAWEGEKRLVTLRNVGILVLHMKDNSSI